MRIALPAGDAWLYLHAELGSSFGGAWIDWRDGNPKLAVGLVESSQHRLEDAETMLANSGLPFRFATVARSYGELEDARDDMAAMVAELDPANGHQPTDRNPPLIVVNEEMNRVDAVLPDTVAAALAESIVPAAVHITPGSLPAADLALGGGWGTASCTIGFPVVSVLDSARAMLTAGHCYDEGTGQPVYNGPGGPITLGVTIDETDDGAGIDREFHSVPSGHTTSTHLMLVDHDGNTLAGEYVDRGFGTRIAQNTPMLYYGYSGIRKCHTGSNYRDPLEVVSFQGHDSHGRLKAVALSPMEGGGVDSIGGDSGGPLWLGNMALGTVRGSTSAPPGIDECAYYSGAYMWFNRIDAQMTDAGGTTIDFVLQEGNGANFTGSGRFVPVTPFRHLDTRTGSPISSGGYSVLDFSPPLANASSVMLNITAVPVSGSGAITASPPAGAGFSVPSNSWAVEFAAGMGASSSPVMVRTNKAGEVKFGVTGGSTHLIVDVLGYVERPNGVLAPSGLEYDSIPTPQRIYDSRSTGGKVGPGETRQITVPSSCTATPALNVTATGATESTYLAVHTTGTVRPDPYSNINTGPGNPTARLVTVPTGTSNRISVYNAFGETHVVVDLMGCYEVNYPSADSHNDGRSIFGGQHTLPAFALAAGSEMLVDLLGSNFPVGPYEGVEAVYLTVDASTTGAGYLNFWRPGTSAPSGTSWLNVESGRAEANAVIAPVNNAGQVRVRYDGTGTATFVVVIHGWVLS